MHLCLGSRSLLRSGGLLGGSLLGSSRLGGLGDTASLGLGQGSLGLLSLIACQYMYTLIDGMRSKTNLLGGSLLRGSRLLGSSGLLGGSSLLLGSLLLGGSSLLRSGSLLSSGLLSSGGSTSLLLRGGSLLLLLGLRLLLGQLGATGGTLGLLKDTLLNTRLESLVEERVKHGIRSHVDGVVGLDVLLQRLSAVRWVSDE